MRISLAVLTATSLFIISATDVTGQPALEELENRLNRLLDPASPTDSTTPDSAGAREPGYLGLFADNSLSGGAVVTSAEPGGPAETAGFQRGDLIRSANGVAIRTIDDLSGVLDRLSAGDIVKFEVARGSATRRIEVELAGRPASAAPAGDPSADMRSATPGDAYAAGPASLGVRVLPVTDETRLRYGYAVRRGAVVEYVRGGTAAEQAGIPIGAVIVSIDGRRVDTPDDLIAYIRSARAGQTVELVYYVGDRITRSSVRLSASSGTASAAPRATYSTPPARTPLFGEDRPALRKIESVIDRLVAPAPVPVPVASPEETVELRAQVEALTRQVEWMQQRIAELEKKLED